MHSLRILIFVLPLFLLSATGQVAAQVVLSELYGGGGNKDATLKNDFIELYNPTDSVILLDGWSVQYNSATATSAWKVTNLNGSIAPHGFYLIQEDAGAGGTIDLPTPDATGSIALSATAGKVALCNTTTALTGVNPISPAIIDLVGFGATANLYEGGSPAPAPSNTASIERKASSASTAETMEPGGAEEFAGNGYDSNDNGNDFFTRIPQPQNSANPAEPEPVDITPPSAEELKNAMPARYELLQNYPNPFNPTTTIEYQIPPSPFSEKGERGGFVSLKVYDLLGREVAMLVNERKPPGLYTVQWNAANLPSGIYFYRLHAGKFVNVKKAVLVK